ncbi:MAG: alkaline phosphatase family protein [Alphaproteobacteria bacterium]
MIKNKVLLIIIDGQPERVARRFMGNLEGWVKSGDARVWKMQSVLPSTSASCYASIGTGVSPQVHGVLSNDIIHKVKQSDVFSAVANAHGKTGAVTHSFWSSFFQRHPFDPVTDLEYDEPKGPIHHGRFHSMTGYNLINQTTPSDADLFATLTMLTERHQIDFGIYHSCTLDSMGHRYGHDCSEMDHACFTLDAQLAAYIPRWLSNGYEIAVTADHGQSDRGHHGGNSADQQDVAFYWFGGGNGPSEETLLDQLQLAPTLLSRMGVEIPETMNAEPFLV